jgi:peptidoglycan/LPS O-acetylase OafA/YrhL
VTRVEDKPRPWRGAPTLSDYAVGRDNNFNLVRLSAALAVLFSHSVAVLGLPLSREFFFEHVGITLADMAVDVFFVTSGFLVTASLIGRGELFAFLWARALRIYPALWAMLILTVFALAPALTSLTLPDYYSKAATYEYFAKCATVLGGVRWSLPGVFETTPLKDDFNISLWTLPLELRLYLSLAVGWLALAVVPAFRTQALKVVAPLAAAIALGVVVWARFGDGAAAVRSGDIKVFMFLYGTSLYLWREKIPVAPILLAAGVACLALACLDRRAFFVVYLLALAPLVLHLAYLPKGRIRRVNEWGDFSYGIYIYAFPIQQTLVFLAPGITLVAMIALSSVLSTLAAAASWFGIEKRALALKGRRAARVAAPDRRAYPLAPHSGERAVRGEGIGRSPGPSS